MIGECIQIPVGKLKPNSYNPNEMSNEDFNSLVDSIANAGFLSTNPLLVRPIAPVKNSEYEYEIVDGEHRWKACTQLGIKEVPCEVREMSDLEAHRHCVILNKDRGALGYFKLSKLFNEDYDTYSRDGKNQEWIGQQFGFKQNTVSEILKIHERLKSIDMSILSSYSNRDLIMLARVRNDRFREALVTWAVGIPSSEIQDAASRCNKLSDYIDEKTKDVEYRNVCYGFLLYGNIIFDVPSVDTLKKAVDTLLDNDFLILCTPDNTFLVRTADKYQPNWRKGVKITAETIRKIELCISEKFDILESANKHVCERCGYMKWWLETIAIYQQHDSTVPVVGA
ncbi:Nucleoid occlusion protein [uncultured archaeon]|nr:Nucleoid occlusion protein [uncultured archaeon]